MYKRQYIYRWLWCNTLWIYCRHATNWLFLTLLNLASSHPFSWIVSCSTWVWWLKGEIQIVCLLFNSVSFMVTCFLILIRPWTYEITCYYIWSVIRRSDACRPNTVNDYCCRTRHIDQLVNSTTVPCSLLYSLDTQDTSRSLLCRLSAVSYTHLDVYKRQNVYYLTFSHSIFTDDGSRWHCRNVWFCRKHWTTAKYPGKEF